MSDFFCLEYIQCALIRATAHLTELCYKQEETFHFEVWNLRLSSRHQVRKVQSQVAKIQAMYLVRKSRLTGSSTECACRARAHIRGRDFFSSCSAMVAVVETTSHLRRRQRRPASNSQPSAAMTAFFVLH